MADLKTIFGRQVRHCRRQRNWTQTQLSGEVGLSLDMIGRLERGQAAPSLETIEKMGVAFSVAPALLLGGAPFTENLAGEREQLLQRIFELLSGVDDTDLERIEQVIGAMIGH